MGWRGSSDYATPATGVLEVGAGFKVMLMPRLHRSQANHFKRGLGRRKTCLSTRVGPPPTTDGLETLILD